MALQRRMYLCAKAEATYGVSASAGGTDYLMVLEPELTPLDAEVLERPVIDAAFGATRAPLMVERKLSLTFGIELAGSGTAGTAPKFSPLMLACGMNLTTVSNTSNTYSVVTSDAPGSAEMLFAWDGNLHQGLGTRGTFSLQFQSGQIPRINFTTQSIYVPPVDGSNPTPTISNQATPVAFDAVNTPTVTIGGTSFCVNEFTLDLGNELFFRSYAGCTQQVQITNRAVTGSITIVRPDSLSTKDFYALAIAGTQQAITFTHGTVAGNRVTPTVPYAVFGAPSPVDLNGTAGLQLPYTALHTANSSDEFTLAFT